MTREETQPKLTVPEKIKGLPIIASVSGGKDSTALILALREAEIPFRAVFADTGWEAAETYAYLDYLRERLSLTIDVVGVPGGMAAKAGGGRGFPTRLGRWCTKELKLEPIATYAARVADETGGDVACAVGIRADESVARSTMETLTDEVELGYWVWRPLLRWSTTDVLGMHSRYGVKVNPLYQAGFNRVGCFPCIFEAKESIRLIADLHPERIDEIRKMEAQSFVDRARLNAEHTPTAKRPLRYTQPGSTFFQGRGNAKADIDTVVAWSRTSRGGRQLPLLAEPPRGGCMRWGLCDTGIDATPPAPVDGTPAAVFTKEDDGLDPLRDTLEEVKP